MKPIIGILSNLKNEPNEGPYADIYKANKIYIDRIIETGGIPLGIFESKEEILEKCDGFLLIGGHRITENHYKIIEFALKHNKPLFGICNGMQAIVMYDYLSFECLKNKLEPTISNLFKMYDELKKQNTYILKKLDHHGAELSQRKIDFNMDTITKFKHSINIKKDSLLYEFYKKDKIDVYSIHTYGVYDTPNHLEVIARSDDGVVEALKYKDKPIIGIQFHVELDNDLVLFEKFIEKCKSSF